MTTGKSERRRREQLYDMAIRVSFPILLGACSWGVLSVIDHESRLVALETTNSFVAKDSVRIEEIRNAQTEILIRLGKIETVLQMEKRPNE